MGHEGGELMEGYRYTRMKSWLAVAAVAVVGTLIVRLVIDADERTACRYATELQWAIDECIANESCEVSTNEYVQLHRLQAECDAERKETR